MQNTSYFLAINQHKGQRHLLEFDVANKETLQTYLKKHTDTVEKIRQNIGKKMSNWTNNYLLLLEEKIKALTKDIIEFDCCSDNKDFLSIVNSNRLTRFDLKNTSMFYNII